MEVVDTIPEEAPERRTTVRLDRLVVPTHDARWALGEHLNALCTSATHADGSELMVIDDAHDPPDAATLDRARRVGGSMAVRVTYAGRAAKEAFAAALATKTGIDPSLVRFALLGEEAPGAAYGANRNLALLASAGRPFASLDDDMGGWLGEPPDREPGVGIGDGDPTEFRFCGDAAEALDAAPRVGRTLLETHERVLGRVARDLVSAVDPPPRPPAPRSVVARKLDAGARVVATWTGFAGDVATPNALLYLAQVGEPRARLLRDEATFEAAWRGRQVVRSARRLSIADGAVWTTGAAAYDARRILPPFFPVLRGEGLIWGATVRACDPGVVAFLPKIVPHAPRGERAPPPGALLAYAESFPLAKLMHHLAMTQAESLRQVSPSQRLRVLGERLGELASGPVGAFAELTKRHRRGHDQAVHATLTRLLHDHGGRPAFWAAHVRAYLERSSGVSPAAYDVPSDVCERFGPERGRDVCRDLVARYGRLLVAWPELWEAARAIGGPPALA
jgi:hypothetical protein